MDLDKLRSEHRPALRAALGYLNFSSGTPDAAFRRQMNELFAAVEPAPAASASGEQRSSCEVVGNLLREELSLLAVESDAFRESRQAAAALALVFDHALAAYRQFHRDLLYHQTDRALFRPFFVARACEAVLRQEAPWDETERLITGAVSEINDFIGHRPVAVLHSRKIEPYSHEWVCPIPLYFRDAGVAVGRYHDIVERAIEVLQQTDREILEAACFDPALLDELALDPRAYDFDHPANKRPNYQFGQWDPHTIDNSGRYRRFVVQEVTLEALAERCEQGALGLPAEELTFEAAAVLAGTMLMAAGISGRGPDTHDSATTLARLLPRIAAYRDEFYERLLARVPLEHGKRLRDEAGELRQPFARARQDLNSRLTRRRAAQLQHVHLAQLFAQMGYAEAGAKQAEIVPVASARMLCQISGRITTSHLALDRGNVAAAATGLSEIVGLLHRGIACGAVVDPWNILGFQGQFSLFPALENSVVDHRVDVLVFVVERVLGLYVRAIGAAAAGGQSVEREGLESAVRDFAAWWDRFATTEVSGIDRVSGREAVEAAAGIGDALAAWHSAGAAAGDVAFWQEHVEGFKSPRAFSMIVRTLLDRGDYAISISLLVVWLWQAEALSLGEGQDSFGQLVLAWLARLRADETNASAGNRPPLSREQRFRMAVKSLDYLEANAGSFWQMPSLFDQPNHSQPPRDAGQNDDELTDDDRDADENLFAAAYEGVTYRDSTADGIQRDTLDESGPASDYELDHEARRLATRLEFLGMVARVWQLAALLAIEPIDAAAAAKAKDDGNPRTPNDEDMQALPDPRESLNAWLRQAAENRRRLLALLGTVHAFRLPAPTAARESLMEFDRRRTVKETLVARVMFALVATAAAERAMRAAAGDDAAGDSSSRWESVAATLLGALLRGDAAAARALFPEFEAELAKQHVLYVPLGKGGEPRRLANVQTLLVALSELLAGLPRLGLLNETCQLLRAIAEAEKRRPGGESAITEFDRLFEIGYRGIVECLAESAASWETAAAGAVSADGDLVECLQAFSEPLLRLWFDHSRLVRLSSLEKLADEKRWQALVGFIERLRARSIHAEVPERRQPAGDSKSGGRKILACDARRQRRAAAAGRGPRPRHTARRGGRAAGPGDRGRGRELRRVQGL